MWYSIVKLFKVWILKSDCLRLEVQLFHLLTMQNGYLSFSNTYLFLAVSGGSCVSFSLSVSPWAPEWVSSVVAMHVLSCPNIWDLSFQTRDQTSIPCIERWVRNHWTTREAPKFLFLCFSSLMCQIRMIIAPTPLCTHAKYLEEYLQHSRGLISVSNYYLHFKDEKTVTKRQICLSKLAKKQ